MASNISIAIGGTAIDMERERGETERGETELYQSYY